MQLKIQRSQRMGGLVGGTVVFCLDVRADYAREEAANIAKYKLGREVIYSSRAAQRHFANAGAHLDRTQEANRLLHRYEGEADKLMLDLLRSLYDGQCDTVQMIVMRDLYELLEKVIDRCRDAGNVILQIALKNS